MSAALAQVVEDLDVRRCRRALARLRSAALVIPASGPAPLFPVTAWEHLLDAAHRFEGTDASESALCRSALSHARANRDHCLAFGDGRIEQELSVAAFEYARAVAAPFRLEGGR